MFHLPRALSAWASPGFATTLASEIEALAADALPLDWATTQGGRVEAEPISVSLLQAEDAGASIQVRVAVFFTEIVGGCSCGDEPMGVPVRCKLQLEISKADASVRCLPLPED